MLGINVARLLARLLCVLFVGMEWLKLGSNVITEIVLVVQVGAKLIQDTNAKESVLSVKEKIQYVVTTLFK